MSRQSNIAGPITANHARSNSKNENETSMWSSMLNSVASQKKLPQKNLIVLGGTSETQKDFIEVLASEAGNRPPDRHKKKPVIANEFALGYTYQDVLDADHEDILARLSIYMLSEPSPSFDSLLKPLFTPKSIPESLLILLLDWSEPWLWVRQIRDWIILLRRITALLDVTCVERMEQVMKDWQQRKLGITSSDNSGSATGNDSNVTLPLGQGEWDEPLGLPLCIVCHNSERIHTLEVERGWKEEDFDFVLQFLRTVLLKHGASLIYTSNSVPNSLPTLIHSSLGIHSLLKKQTLKHNVIDRDKVLVPPNWDSWGKIRVLREGFDVEGTSTGWSIDIQEPPPPTPSPKPESEELDPSIRSSRQSTSSPEGAVLQLYESTVSNPYPSSSTDPFGPPPKIEVLTTPTQEFLATQLESLTRLQAEEEHLAAQKPNSNSSVSERSHDDRVTEHIGPVQVNMGGIQVDADDMLKRLRNREREGGSRSPEKMDARGGELSRGVEEEQAVNEKTATYFASLMKRATGSPRATPGKEGKGGAGSGSETPSKKL